ncbi:MAG: hypothetical protein ABIT76_00320 [Chthoniobacterales bacterium]
MTTEFHLYRAKFIRPAQTSFLYDELTTSDLFISSLQTKPYAAYRKSYTWHIANLLEFSALTGVFRIGRNSPTSIPRLDIASGDFVDTESETSPNTEVIYDAQLGIVAIRKESDLTGTTAEVASKIAKLLGQTDVIMRNEVDVKVDPIPDPSDFISRLNDANAIKKFTAWFTGPNPFDADELFQKPLSVYLNAANGTYGEATIQGSHLNPEVVKEVARSTAATGNKASARIQEEAGKRTIRINLSGDPVKLVYEKTAVDLKTVLSDAQGEYERVRHDSDRFT